jgi:hypothetical protein
VPSDDVVNTEPCHWLRAAIQEHSRRIMEFSPAAPSTYVLVKIIEQNIKFGLE